MKAAWTDSEVEKPKQSRWYDMCLLDLGNRIITGWWTGTGWDGLHYKGQSVKKWKRMQ